MINNNIPALFAINANRLLTNSLSKNVSALSRGLRINSAADDAAGLAIAEKMLSQIRGLAQANRNAQDGLSMVQTAEGALGEITSVLQRIRELTVQAANDTLTSGDRQYIQNEIDQLKEEVNNIAKNTQFNKKKLLDGSGMLLLSYSGADIDVIAGTRTGKGTQGSGNYKISVTTAQQGQAEILKSNVFYAINGTQVDKSSAVYKDQNITGLWDVNGLNLAVDDYALETREVPYGGTTFYKDGVLILNPADYPATHGVVSLEALGYLADGTKVPYGEYQFRGTTTAPFMATYDLNADGTGAVSDVWPPTYGNFAQLLAGTADPTQGTLEGVFLDRAINSDMEFLASVLVGARQDTVLWFDDNGTGITLADIQNSAVMIERANYAMNMFTTFDVVANSNVGRWYWADTPTVSTHNLPDPDGFASHQYTGLTFSTSANGVSLSGLGVEELHNTLGGAWVAGLDPGPPNGNSTGLGQFSYDLSLSPITITIGGMADIAWPGSPPSAYTAADYQNFSDALRKTAWDNLVNTGQLQYFGLTTADLNNPAYVTISHDRTAGSISVTLNNLGATTVHPPQPSREVITVTATCEGVDMNGTRVVTSETITQSRGSGNFKFSNTAIPYQEIAFDAFLPIFLTDPMPDLPPYNHSSLQFAIYTSPDFAASSDIIRAQTAVQLSGHVGAGYVGDIWPQLDYVFNDGVLDGKTIGAGKDITIPFLARVTEYFEGGGGTQYLQRAALASYYHSFEINGSFGSATDALSYNYRSTDPVPGDGYTHNYKSQTWYGTDATSYFYNGGNPNDYFVNINAWAQEDTNATMAFRYRGTNSLGHHVFDVQTEGYERDGTRFAGETFLNVTIDPLLPARLTIGRINFDDFVMDWSKLTEGDAFAVNISAATFANRDGSPAGLVDFKYGTDIISTAGQPVDDPLQGAAMQYRFDSDVINGQELRLLGLMVDSVIGDDEKIGIQRQTFYMKIDANGLMPQTLSDVKTAPSGVGSYTYTDPWAYVGDVNLGRTILCEVNYVGQSTPVAAACVTGFFFDALKNGQDRTLRVSDFIGAVDYAENSEWNGSLLFDALEVHNGSVKFRIQGHLYDAEGNYRYVEEHNFWLNADTNSNVLLFEGDNFEGRYSASPFAGLTFDNIILGSDTTKFSVGDRFTVSLLADARGGGYPISDWDEIHLMATSDIGTRYPCAWRFKDGFIDDRTLDLKIFQIDSKPLTPRRDDVQNNYVRDGVFSITTGTFHGGTIIGDRIPGSTTPRKVRDAVKFTVRDASGIDAGVAQYYTKLKDISAFYNSSGKFLLDMPQILTIRQGEYKKDVVLHGEMELKDLVEAIGAAAAALNPTVARLITQMHDREHFTEYMNHERHTGDTQAVPGTLVLRSVLSGGEGKYDLIGDDDLLKALSFVTVAEAKESTYNAAAYDAHSGKTVSRARVEGGSYSTEVLPGGAAIKFTSELGITSIYFDEKKGEYVSRMPGEYSRFVHLKYDDITLQIGANEKETLSIALSDMSAKAIGIDDIYVSNRDIAATSITKIDSAINKVSTLRADMGAVAARLEHSITISENARGNTMASESRIRDLDFSKEMLQFTKNQILLQANTSIMAQANSLPQGVLSLLKF